MVVNLAKNRIASSPADAAKADAGSGMQEPEAGWQKAGAKPIAKTRADVRR